tara:strand:- start:1069 stop:1314 length:246 start_codon:yes stop_codon:yes gene_type:complete
MFHRRIRTTTRNINIMSEEIRDHLHCRHMLELKIESLVDDIISLEERVSGCIDSANIQMACTYNDEKKVLERVVNELKEIL